MGVIQPMAQIDEHVRWTNPLGDALEARTKRFVGLYLLATRMATIPRQHNRGESKAPAPGQFAGPFTRLAQTCCMVAEDKNGWRSDPRSFAEIIVQLALQGLAHLGQQGGREKHILQPPRSGTLAKILYCCWVRPLATLN